MAREMACVYYDNQKCTKFEEPGYVSWCVLGPCSHQVPSRADKFRAMSDEELAHEFALIAGWDRAEYEKAKRIGVEKVMLDWLRQPAESSEEDFSHV